ncbi:TetR family transcriptional regulator [Edaphobacter acidisoli]|uniref:TetR family transcriptional regulator n=1 Tax=Edaphobacter acidisoli TaxID=2040573 RepID=A0A916W7V6_9BACT|nr:TetR/AcrR family transcriptional regulator [Edaphobacter acidisoli]GGA75296.1 TetR family transcriptional regulator [Edaphobacter acidisoli]
MRFFPDNLPENISDGEAEVSKGELTRQRIIEEAAPIFNQRGYAGCSMQDVMEATGLEKGGIYRHFSNKEELAAEAFRYNMGRSVRFRMDAVVGVEGAVEKLRAYVRSWARTPSVIPGGCPMLNTAVDADDGNPLLRKLVTEAVQDWKGRIGRIVEEGIAAGEIREDVDPRKIANTLIATLEGALMITRLEGTKEAMRDAQATLESVISAIARE